MRRLTASLAEFLHKGDLILLSLCTLASLYGIVLIYSATRWSGGNRSLIVQSVALVIGICLYIGLTLVDFRALTEKFWKLFLLFDVGFLMLLLTPLGTDNDSGNLNWIALDRIIPGFPLDLQPNEIVKIPFILLLAYQITRIQDRELDISSIPCVIQIAGHTLLMVGLIAVICGDMGMCLVYLCIFVVMAWIAGVRLRWFLFGGVGAVGAFLLAWKTILQAPPL